MVHIQVHHKISQVQRIKHMKKCIYVVYGGHMVPTWHFVVSVYFGVVEAYAGPSEVIIVS